MVTRWCEDCGTERVSGRRVFCRDCGRARRNGQQRERDEAARERGKLSEDSGRSGELAGQVIDYTQGGHQAPDYDVMKLRPPQRPAEPAVISDGRVASPAEREARHRLDFSGLPASIRHDHTRAQRMAAARLRGADEPDPRLDWNDLESVQAHFAGNDRMVDFRPMPTPPQPRTNAIGQSMPRPRGLGR